MEKNKTAERMFQLALVLVIPSITYVYTQGIKTHVVDSLDVSITSLNSTVKDLVISTNHLATSTAMLSAESVKQDKRIERLEGDVRNNQINIATISAGRK